MASNKGPVENEIPRISVRDTMTPESVAEEMAKNLEEPNKMLIYGIVSALGVERSIRYYNRTRIIERQGGLYCEDGSGRRTPGGVFFYMVQNDPSSSQCAKEVLLSLKMKMKQRQRRRNQEYKEHLIREGLLTVSKVPLKTN